MSVWSADITYKTKVTSYGTISVSYNICLDGIILYKQSLYCLVDNVAELIELSLYDSKLAYEKDLVILIGTKITI